MKITFRTILTLSILSLQTVSLFAGGTQSDYERANSLGRRLANKVTKQRITPHWFADNSKFWYRNDLSGDRRQFVLVNAEEGTRKPAFNHKRLAKRLSETLDQQISRDKLPIDALAFEGNGFSFTAKGKRYKCTRKNYRIELVEKKAQSGSDPKTLSELRPSGPNGPETWLTFHNKRKSDIEIYWIDSNRQRRHYKSIKPNGKHRQHTYANHVWLVADRNNESLGLFEATQDEAQIVIDANSTGPALSRRPRRSDPSGRSPDGKWIAQFKDHNLLLGNTESNTEMLLTTDGTEQNEYSGLAMWSPDSKRIAVLRTKKGQNRQIHLIESSPDDQLQPKLHTLTYVKPGDEINTKRPYLFDVEKQQEIELFDKLYDNPWSISAIRWSPDSSRFTFLYNQRGHQVLRIVEIDARTGKARPIIDELSKTFIDYNGKRYLHYCQKTDELIWMSERDGWNHLYLYDSQAGKVKNQITKGQWVVRGVERVDEEARQIWFRAGGIRPDQDPYYIHYCRVNFDGSDLVVLTEGNGTHSIDFSPDRRFFIDRYSRVDHPGTIELRKTDDGSLVCELEKADFKPLLKTGWRPPEPFVAKGRDGKTDIYGIIIRPSNFDPRRKYPVIESIYAGPHSAFVAKSFGLQTRRTALAELGFIVVQIDGMGTSHRSKAFHDVCWKNLGDSGFPDRIAWIKAAAKKYPYMDITRVGIYGGSAGGQSTLRGMLAHPEFYKVGVADCGCHDNRMDKIWWNELWMGWPIGPHYDEQSNVTQAHRLEGKLLLTVGELDRNVDPASSLQVVDALIKADKDFDFLLVPGRGHGVGETPYANRRRMDFFVRHLLGVEPRSKP